MPKVSVIMSVFSEDTQQLQRSMDSILEQTFSDFEFIIVLDNLSNQAAKQYISERAKQDVRIVFLKNKENIKLGASLNIWIEKSKGKYMARMDGDDACKRNKLEKQYNYLEANSNIDLLFTWWQEIDEKWVKQTRIPCKKDFENLKRTFFYKSPLLHASMMCKREVFHRHSYPEIDRPEDFSLFLELIKEWYRFGILEENLYTFYIDSYNLEKKFQKIHVFSSNFLKILWKNKSYFSLNPYYWWMVFVCSIQWILSRNKYLFFLSFNTFQSLYKKIFIKPE